MNVAVVHYHLNHGGVTRVIANQLRALDRTCSRGERLRIALLSSGQTQGWPEDLGPSLDAVDVVLGAASRLQYDTHPVDESPELACQLRSHLSALGFEPDQTVLHVHNHSLGKNASLPGSLRLLAEDGYALLLQIHDFAEDCRPRNYCHLIDAWGGREISTWLYPQAERIHYAVLNRRDHTVLMRAGVPAERLHYLPNAIGANGCMADRKRARQEIEDRFGIPTNARLLLYPVRAIRRKNLGEAILWSVLGGQTVHVGVTLAPESPAEQPYYERWKEVARESQLRVRFEIGGACGLPLHETLASADLTLTTSVAEGFGMAFLESWAAERALVGRNLPEVTADLAASGLRLDHLYCKLKIPLELIGRTTFHLMLLSAYSGMLASYRRPVPAPLELSRMTAQRRREGVVDFADLDEGLQEHVLRRLQTEPRLRELVLELNPSIPRALEAPCAETRAMMLGNRLAVHREYSLTASGVGLWRVYQKVMASPRNTRLAGPRRGGGILADFLAPNRFRPIRG